MTSEANWQAQQNEQQEWDADHDLHTAWCNVAMDLASNYAEAYCNHQCDDSKDCLQELGRARLELKRHLWGQPASMGPVEPTLQPAHNDTALLRQALYVIEAWERGCDKSDYWRDRDDAIAALRTRLEGKT